MMEWNIFVKTQYNSWLNNVLHFPLHQIFMAIIDLVLDIKFMSNRHQNTTPMKFNKTLNE